MYIFCNFKQFIRLVSILCLVEIFSIQIQSQSISGLKALAFSSKNPQKYQQIENRINDTIVIEVLGSEYQFDDEPDQDLSNWGQKVQNRSKRQIFGYPNQFGQFGGHFGQFGGQFGSQSSIFQQYPFQQQFQQQHQQFPFQQQQQQQLPFQQQQSPFQQQQQQSPFQFQPSFIRYPQQGQNQHQQFPGFPSFGGFPQLPSLVQQQQPVRIPTFATTAKTTTTTKKPIKISTENGQKCRNLQTWREGVCISQNQCHQQTGIWYNSADGSYSNSGSGMNGMVQNMGQFYQYQGSQQCTQQSHYSIFGRQFGSNLVCCPMSKSSTTTTTTTRKPYWATQSTTTQRNVWTQATTKRNRLTNRPPVIAGKPPAASQNRPKPTAPSVPSSCGQPTIIGGHEARHYPWIVGLIHEPKGRLYCGGSLIDSQHVITAAHCVKSRSTNFPLNEIRVTIGDHDITRIGEVKHHVRRISKAFVHAGFNDFSFSDDIAILRLSQPVDAKPVCLFSPSDSKKRYDDGNTYATVVGWGQTIWQGPQVPSPTATVLKEVSIRVMTNSECAQIYQQQRSVVQIQEKMVCAGSHGKDSCRGDSGGPLMLQDAGVYKQIGLVSFGIDCGKGPGVYTRIDRYADWLNRNLKRT